VFFLTDDWTAAKKVSKTEMPVAAIGRGLQFSGLWTFVPTAATGYGLFRKIRIGWLSRNRNEVLDEFCSASIAA
jgi:hypothetical protein